MYLSSEEKWYEKTNPLNHDNHHNHKNIDTQKNIRYIITLTPFKLITFLLDVLLSPK